MRPVKAKTLQRIVNYLEKALRDYKAALSEKSFGGPDYFNAFEEANSIYSTIIRIAEEEERETT